MLLLHPRLVLLGEPTIGLAASAMTFVYVLEQGQVRFEESGEEILAHPELRRAYLGG